MALARTSKARIPFWLFGAYLVFIGFSSVYELFANDRFKRIWAPDLILLTAIGLAGGVGGVFLLVAGSLNTKRSRTASRFCLAAAAAIALVAIANAVHSVLAISGTTSGAAPADFGERVGEFVGAGIWVIVAFALFATSRWLWAEVAAAPAASMIPGRDVA